jgi:hypothetical protein
MQVSMALTCAAAAAKQQQKHWTESNLFETSGISFAPITSLP